MWASFVLCEVDSCVAGFICGVCDLREGGVPGGVSGLCLLRMCLSSIAAELYSFLRQIVHTCMPL